MKMMILRWVDARGMMNLELNEIVMNVLNLTVNYCLVAIPDSVCPLLHCHICLWTWEG